MPPRDWKIRILDIRKAACKIIEHTSDVEFAVFAADEWTLDAVLRNFLIIGEAACRVPVHVQSEHPAVPWRDMQDMRNLIVHEYFGVDPAIDWKTIREDLPALHHALDASFGSE